MATTFVSIGHHTQRLHFSELDTQCTSDRSQLVIEATHHDTM